MWIQLFVGILLISSSLAANSFVERERRSVAEKSCLIELYSTEDTSILARVGEKFYVNPDRLCISDEGISLRTDSSYLHYISHLFFDEGGYYYQEPNYYWRCVNGHIISIRNLYCPDCGDKRP